MFPFRQTVLVVDDDQAIRNLVCIYLEKEGYEVVEASNGEAAKQVYLHHHPCLIILDLQLPKVSGETFCQWLRQDEKSEVAIIIISNRTSVEDKITALRMGADDYVTKPFEPLELMAHVDAVLRRTGQFCQKIAHEGLCIMPRKGEVQLYNRQLHLTNYEFNLLYYFMQNPDIVLSREQLVMQIHPNTEHTVMDRTIDAHIKKLREKIEDELGNPKRIKTVRGIGYKFVKPVR
ncbi:response regulator transcription factor [Salinibacillus xinjiangensis]|uniref:Response regulator n=1 Tax=Salinibacillus xinjiangensis TaxID=1229268 RepID=A0A6G1X997_9BACI|nr:response regulator transcription factor [Salinibacillus xinjiangensis]MRG87475.1 response regulator [Salinibacillus xinjiangensis]